MLQDGPAVHLPQQPGAGGPPPGRGAAAARAPRQARLLQPHARQVESGNQAAHLHQQIQDNQLTLPSKLNDKQFHARFLFLFGGKSARCRVSARPSICPPAAASPASTAPGPAAATTTTTSPARTPAGEPGLAESGSRDHRAHL